MSNPTRRERLEAICEADEPAIVPIINGNPGGDAIHIQPHQAAIMLSVYENLNTSNQAEWESASLLTVWVKCCVWVAVAEEAAYVAHAPAAVMIPNPNGAPAFSAN